jgi:Xaa-Pro aminopeptidase
MPKARFQTFDDDADKAATSQRLTALRAELARRNLTGVVVPRTDRHQNEYVARADERLAWLSGFTGSAGIAIVLPDRAVLFVDGRYTLQAREQIAANLFTVENIAETTLESWIEANLEPGATLGYDPWLHTVSGAEKLAKACAAAGAKLAPAELIDAIWQDRPTPPLGQIELHDVKFAGEPAGEKLKRVHAEIERLKADALIITDPTALAWTFNIRGSDVAHTPVALGFAVIPVSGRPALYLDGRKLSNIVRSALESLADVRAPGQLTEDLAAVGASHKKIRLDQATGADAINRIVSDAGGTVLNGPDPIALMKAIKNANEIAGARAAHLRDGLALSRFLAWFEQEAALGKLTEIDAVCALEDFRRQTDVLKDISFPTIAGSGPHGAIVHYRVTNKSNRRIAPGEIFLVDSGAQYEDGTTDITRTVVVGEATAEMRDRFTRVLKGHIAIATAIFPEGTTGAQLDSLARLSLWAAGLDFDHGTGHGVGSYLSVHEGPARISKLGTVPLRRGMILSNEPGYYKADAYGIRIENLVLVTEAPPVPGADKPLNGFETLSLAPIDRRLIEPSLLDPKEIAWLDEYHARVRNALTPMADATVSHWLAHATRPVVRI